MMSLRAVARSVPRFSRPLSTAVRPAARSWQAAYQRPSLFVSTSKSLSGRIRPFSTAKALREPAGEGTNSLYLAAV